MEEKIQKINVPYLIGYILIPIAICALSFMIGYKFFPKGNGAVITFMVPPILSFIWWAFGGSFLFKRNSKNFEKTLDETGFKRAHTFYGRGKTVFIDTENGKIGLVFFWNPTKTYTVPASKVESAWVDDGKGGSGFMEGSSRVSFLFNIDDVKIRVNTFTSNQRWRMDSDYILTGISKADMMVEVIEKARSNSK